MDTLLANCLAFRLALFFSLTLIPDSCRASSSLICGDCSGGKEEERREGGIANNWLDYTVEHVSPLGNEIWSFIEGWPYPRGLFALKECI